MTIDRYLARETIKPFCLIALFLTGVFIAHSLTRFLTEANDGLLNTSIIFALIGLKALIALEVLLPISLYIGMIMALGRLFSNWEVVAMRAGGLSEYRVMLPVLSVAFIIALLVAVLSLWARPWAYGLLYQFEANAKATAEVGTLSPRQFHIYGKDGRTVFLDDRDENTGELRGIFVRSRRDGVLEVISAASGHFNSFARADAHLLQMLGTLVYKQTPSGEEVVGRFKDLKIWTAALEAEPLGHKPKSAPTAQLLASDLDADRAERQWRASTACSTLLLALVAVPLSRTRPRSGRSARLLLAIVIYAIYFNLIGIARSEVEQGAWDHIWWVPAGLAASVGAAWLAFRRSAP